MKTILRDHLAYYDNQKSLMLIKNHLKFITEWKYSEPTIQSDLKCTGRHTLVFNHVTQEENHHTCINLKENIIKYNK